MARVCVFCASSTTIEPRHIDLARDLGRALAARGHDLVSGGGRVSMMGAVAEGVREGGGHTLGVIPQALVALEVADQGAHELVITDDMRLRKGRMDAEADAFIALPGGLGTLEELFEVWTSRVLGMHARPVLVLDPTGVYDPLRSALDGLVAQGFLRQSALDVVPWCRSIDEALDVVDAALAARAR